MGKGQQPAFRGRAHRKAFGSAALPAQRVLPQGFWLGLLKPSEFSEGLKGGVSKALGIFGRVGWVRGEWQPAGSPRFSPLHPAVETSGSHD